MKTLKDYLIGFVVGIVIVAAGIMIADYLTQRLEQRAADSRKSECIGRVLGADATTERLAAMAMICVEDQ